VRFFFYGTLVAGSENAIAEAAHGKLTPAGGATVPGRLFAIPDRGGWYPALVPGKGQVAGQLYDAKSDFDDDDLARLDAYEGPAYRRQSVRAKEEGGAASIATAYIWRTRIPARAVLIESGDFAHWLAETGNKPFSA
jgi:gamma-glutamylcyclotransferase (GGCT)/AIG2-like uncharacterized protein YtfP